MGDLIFVVKTLVITVALVVLMQIKVGSRTIEQHSIAWIHQSAVVGQLQEVAAGAVKAGTRVSKAIKGYLGVGIKSARDVEIEKIGKDAMAKATEVAENAADAASEATDAATEKAKEIIESE